MTLSTRRICLALDLKNDADLIAEYERRHAPGNAWPEVTRSIRDAGIERMEIYRIENRLVMVMDVNESFDPEARKLADMTNPRVQAWESEMSGFQQPLASAEAGEKWLEMKCIFKLSGAERQGK